jgi:hypothetical protein
MLGLIVKHYGILIGLILFVLGVAVVSTVVEAYVDFKNKPREPMFWCHKHGYFRMKHTLPLFPELGGKAENSHMCPTCYYETVFKNVQVN